MNEENTYVCVSFIFAPVCTFSSSTEWAVIETVHVEMTILNAVKLSRTSMQEH
jgi:hypothetical protein